MFVVLVTQSRVAAGLLALANGATLDSGGRERPISRSRLKRKLILPHAPYYYYYYYYYYDYDYDYNYYFIIIIIIIIILVQFSFFFHLVFDSLFFCKTITLHK